MPAWAGGQRRRLSGRTSLLGVVLLVAATALALYLRETEAALAPGTALTGAIERVVDGDTLLIGGQRLRLVGLDAPELAQACSNADGSAWDCGAVARNRLRAILGAESVSCEFRRTDRYGRPLVTCRNAAGQDAGAVLVTEGLAMAYGGYTAEEAAARRDRVGIWQGRFENPEDWRRSRTAEESAGNPSRFERLLGWLGQWLGS